MKDTLIPLRVKLAALWITMMLLYIYADILSLFRPGQLNEMIGGSMGPFPATQFTLLAAAILMAIPVAMVFLSLVMKPEVNRKMNTVVGILYVFVNISNLIGESWAYYLMLGILEIVLALLIVWYAWTWPNDEISKVV